ncbi:MAG: ImmA/IrrE family metallo-endopeptidase [Peptostreptococcaceae bacterium]|nr:ImmA/IrrE family metallo-endopeptidase [Peptostreptococcaceae bacterium]
MSNALINSPVLKWARLRSHLDIEFVAKRVSVKVEKLMKWESGEAVPTFRQAQNLANVLHIPFGYLFLKEPPIEKLLLPDLRTIDDEFYADFSVDLREVISNVIIKQDWYKDYRRDQEYPEISFIEKFNDNTENDVIVQEITELLKLTFKDRESVQNWENFYQLLVERAESLGLWIMRASIVGSNTHRRLDVNEFRGFAICDKIAPAIFINGADAKAAQIFTLIHEIVHLWFGSSGVSNIDFRKNINSFQNNREKKCNEIAAEILVPKEMLQKMWDKRTFISENAENLCRVFKVSSIVIARRALDLGLVYPEDFFGYYKTLVEIWNIQKQKQKESGGGPSYYVNIPINNGRRFSMEVLNSVYSQNLLMRDGAKLLGLNPATLNNFAKEVGIR